MGFCDSPEAGSGTCRPGRSPHHPQFWRD